MSFIKRLSIWIVLLFTFVLATGCSDTSTSDDSSDSNSTGGNSGGGDNSGGVENITLLTGETGGTYYVNGAGVAEIINDQFGDEFNTTVQSTGGSIDNMTQISGQQADMAYGPSTVLNDAYNGDGSMYEVITEPHEDLRLVWYMYPMPMHVIALADSGIETISDLQGKRVAATPGAGVASMTELFEEYFGLNEGDFEVVPIGFSDGITMLTDGGVDVLTYYAGAPTPSVMELMSQEDVTFIPFADEDLTRLLEERPVYVPYTFTGEVYEGLTREVSSYASSVVIFAHSETSDDKVYATAKAINENIDALTEMHSSGAHATLENYDAILKNPFIPIHPGTEKYLEEIGHSY